MANTIKKIVLVRKKDMRSDFLESSPFAQFVVGEPLALSPLDTKGWPHENGLSHYGFVIAGLKLRDLEQLRTFWENPESVPMQVLDWVDVIRAKKDRPERKLKDEQEQIEATLQHVGLGINPLADENFE